MGDFTFRVEEEAHIANFVVNALRGKQISLDFLRLLRQRCIIDDTTTLAQLYTEKYAGFMSALFLSLSLKLPDTPNLSNYGMGKFSDLEVLHNFGAQQKRKDFTRENPDRCNNLTSLELDELQKHSAVLRRWVNNQQKALISHWDLPEGDLKPKVEKPRKATKERIAEEAAKKMDDVSSKRAREQLYELVGNMHADRDKEDEPDSGDEARKAFEAKDAAKRVKTADDDLFSDEAYAVHQASGKVKDLSLENQVFTVPTLIAQFPRLAMEGMHIRFDVAEGKVYAQDHEGESLVFDIYEEYTL